MLLHVLDDPRLELGGYAAIRIKDVSRLEIVTDFIARAAVLFEWLPEPPQGIDCADWRSLVRTAADRFPLLGVEEERLWPGSMQIGAPGAIKKRSMLMDTVDTDARWDKSLRIRYKNVTRITFGDGYIKALATVLRRDRESAHEEK